MGAKPTLGETSEALSGDTCSLYRHWADRALHWLAGLGEDRASARQIAKT